MEMRFELITCAFGRGGQIDATYVSELSEECFDFIVTDLCGKSTNEDFAMTGLCLFRVDLFVVDDVLGHSCDFIDRFGGSVYDECETTGAASLWIGLHIYAFNITILSEMFTQFLCGWNDGNEIKLANWHKMEMEWGIIEQ